MRNKGKRWMAAALVAVLTCTNFFIPGTNVSEVYADGEATQDFIIEGNVLTGYTGSGGEVVIPDGVRSIGAAAFNNCKSLTSVTIPESVTDIGNAAFRNCSGLTKVSLPNSLSDIEYRAFENCSSLPEVAIPENISSLSTYAFAGCSSLTSVNIPNSIKKIGAGTFAGCSDLTSVTIPEGIDLIGRSAFQGCSGLTNVTIPESVTFIGYYAFRDCNNLESVTFPKEVTDIGNGSFSGCTSLTSIAIPDEVRYVGDGAFAGCYNLENIKVDENNTIYDSRNNCNAIIYTSTNELKAGCKNTTIPDDVTTIMSYAFRDCSGLTSITIPASVTNIWDEAFSGCSGLTSITVDENNSNYDSRNNCNAIIKTQTKELLVGCKNTIIPEGVTSIRAGAFKNCSGLTSITIPESVTSIGNEAFCACNGLTSITIPKSVSNIGYRAFGGCSNLETISVDGENSCYDSRENCNAIIQTSTNELKVGCKSTIIPESVTGIGSYAFDSCSGLTNVTIPESVTSIGPYAFRNCSGLTSVTIPESVSSIGYTAFSGCSGLTSVTIPGSVKIIEPYTFEACSGLLSVIISEGVTTVDSSAFVNCSRLSSMIIPASVTIIGPDAIPRETTLIVEEGSYGETYAKKNGYKYRTALICDATENPVLTKETVNDLIEKNAEKDVSILSNNGVEFTFAKGTMNAVEGLDNYDFGTTITTIFAEAALPDSITEEEFVAKISYNYSGQLPGEASIKLFVGEGYAGKTMKYSLLKDDNTLGESQSAKVDSEGYITVKQSHCSAYVITLEKGMMGDVNSDGSITAEDALAILKHVVGLEQLTGNAIKNADVNADNGITAEDALSVLKKVVGLIENL